MHAETFLATTGEGVVRAELAPNGNWDVYVQRWLGAVPKGYIDPQRDHRSLGYP